MKFKKIATVLGSALMVGSTMGLAAAAAYPAPFVSNGVADVAIVYGTNGAATADYTAAMDISANLNSALAGQTAAGVAVVDTTNGESVLVESGSDNLNLGNSLNLIGTINDEDMETFLASGKYKDIDQTEFTYDQTITPVATQLQYSTSSAYKDKTPAVGLFYDKDADVLSYSVDFNGLNFSNAIGTDLPLMGNMYYVLDYSAADGLTLLDSSSSATFSEGETKTISVNGKSYEVTLDFVGDAATDYAKFTVNGVSTDKINEGSDEELDDGSYIAVKEVLYSAKESGISKVEFTIGTGKLLLPTAGEVEMNDDRVVSVDSTINAGNGILTIDWNTDAKTVLTEAGDELLLPGFNTLKVIYSGMEFPEAEETILDAAGTIELETSVKDGSVSVPLVNFDAVTANGNLSYRGEDTDTRLILGTGSATNQTVALGQVGDYFVATYASGDEYESYVYQLDSIKYGSDNKTEVVLDNMASTDATDDITFVDLGRDRTKGKLTFTLSAANETTEDVTVYVTASTSGVSTQKLVTADGLSISLAGLSNLATANLTTGVNLTFQETDKDLDFELGTAFTATLTTTADSNIHVSATNVTVLETKTNDVWAGYVISDLATIVDFDKTDTDAQDFAISYNGVEVVAKVYVAAASVSATPVIGETGALVVKDSEADKMTGKNLIVVGGNCVNSVAASLLGLSAGATCASDFAKTGAADGKFLIKSFDKAGKIALLVAGYSAADTTKAKLWLVNNKVDSEQAKKGLVGTGVNAADVVVA